MVEEKIRIEASLDAYPHVIERLKSRLTLNAAAMQPRPTFGATGAASRSRIWTKCLRHSAEPASRPCRAKAWGLAYVQVLVRRHGGRIWIQTHVGLFKNLGGKT